VPVPEPPEKKVLRRLTPSRVALLLDLWMGRIDADIMGPFEKAEAAYARGDFGGALAALDVLSVRFAEPRWPTLPDPFRLLRVPIPAPVPPHWDPDHALPVPEKDSKKARKAADEQLALARASVDWAGSHGVAVADLLPRIEAATAHLADPSGLVTFYGEVDLVWAELHRRLPLPKAGAAPKAPAGAEEA
jgi:hypothetical protein